MKFVIDQSIPFIKGIFEPYAQILYRDGAAIAPSDLKDADALIVLHNTKCTETLLSGSAVKIIATATIGTDHIDLSYCKQNDIYVQNAPGCNAGGVMNYVFSALYGAASRERIPLTGSTMGIIGVGQVGSRIESMAKHLGFKLLLCDPPRAEAEGSGQFVSLDTLLANSDVVTLHVPLNDTTRGMADADFFAKMKFGAFFINTARGGIVDEGALLEAMPRLGPVIIDNWNNEPNVNLQLLEKASIATPHIAGYSYQGKQRGTSAAVRSVARFFGIEPLYDFYPVAEVQELEAVKLDLSGLNQGQIASVFQYNYPVFTDDFMFRVDPGSFEHLRTNYSYRREFYF
ncbi:MAG: 4-phosphoerythronate dehydrogenase [Bacteroidales bacterium]|nr:4-phosphoerythronate dehydrogenase [Bacteroidales bacterium]